MKKSSYSTIGKQSAMDWEGEVGEGVKGGRNGGAQRVVGVGNGRV